MTTMMMVRVAEQMFLVAAGAEDAVTNALQTAHVLGLTDETFAKLVELGALALTTQEVELAA